HRGEEPRCLRRRAPSSRDHLPAQPSAAARRHRRRGDPRPSEHHAPRSERSPAVARGVIRKAMSYILDALKKAEREHHQAKVPTLETMHGTSWAPPRHLWLGIGAAVALANVAVLIWLLVPGPMPSIDRSADSTVTPAAAPPAAVSAPSAPPAAPAAPEKPAASTPAPPIPPVAAAPGKPAAPPAAVSPPKPAERGTGSLPLLRDMTPADQEAITKMTLQFLVYSDVPGERL